jgi:hypothetical protein
VYIRRNSVLLAAGSQEVFSWGACDGALDSFIHGSYAAQLQLALAPTASMPYGTSGGFGNSRGGSRHAWGAQGGFSKGEPGPTAYNSLLESIKLPDGVSKNEVCLNFWVHGSCGRASCKFAPKGHTCLLCHRPRGQPVQKSLGNRPTEVGRARGWLLW